MKSSSSAGSLGKRSTSRGGVRRQRGGLGDLSPDTQSQLELQKRSMVFPFDLGVFQVVAELYDDQTYAMLAASLMDRAPPGSILRSTAATMRKTASSKLPSSKLGRSLGGSGQRKDPDTSVIFHLPSVDEHGGMNWDLSSYVLPTGRDKESREARKNLFKYLDSSSDGSIKLVEFKAVFAGMVTVPGKMDARVLLNHGLDRAFQAVQELMLDGMSPGKDDHHMSISQKEFRVFLIFLQRYLELYEIFCSIDDSIDQMISIEEFIQALPKLETWGMNDPSIARNPDGAFRKIDKDGSGYVTFPEFAEFCIRQGLIEEVEKEIRNKEST